MPEGNRPLSSENPEQKVESAFSSACQAFGESLYRNKQIGEMHRLKISETITKMRNYIDSGDASNFKYSSMAFVDLTTKLPPFNAGANELYSLARDVEEKVQKYWAARNPK